MIKVTFIHDDRRRVLKMEGHADTAEYGHDLVCAVASAYLQLLGDTVLEMARKGKLVSPPTVSWEQGKGFIDAEATREGYDELRTAFAIFENGFRQLTLTEPKAVQTDVYL